MPNTSGMRRLAVKSILLLLAAGLSAQHGKTDAPTDALHDTRYDYDSLGRMSFNTKPQNERPRALE